MSTNYYFENKKSISEAQRYNEGLDELVNEFKIRLIEYGCDEDLILNNLEDIRYLNGKMVKDIHIGKRSAGWKPLFEVQEEYQGISGMKKWYEQNKDEWNIVNEYGEHFTWNELEQELINWNGMKSNVDFVNENYFHSREYSIIEGYEWYDGEFS